MAKTRLRRQHGGSDAAFRRPEACMSAQSRNACVLNAAKLAAAIEFVPTDAALNEITTARRFRETLSMTQQIAEQPEPQALFEFEDVAVRHEQAQKVFGCADKAQDLRGERVRAMQ